MAYKTKEQRREAAAEEKKQDAGVSNHGPNCTCIFHRAERARMIKSEVDEQESRAKAERQKGTRTGKGSPVEDICDTPRERARKGQRARKTEGAEAGENLGAARDEPTG